MVMPDIATSPPMHRSTFLLKSAASSSSNRWLARQSSDPYVRARLSRSRLGVFSEKAKDTDQKDISREEAVGAHRSRASYKLLELWKKHPGMMRRGGKVVDLGAAPGGWSQVAQQAVTSSGLVLAIDLLPIVPIDGVTFLQGDFLSHAVQGEFAAILTDKLASSRKPRKQAWWSLRKEAGEGSDFGLRKAGRDGSGDGGVAGDQDEDQVEVHTSPPRMPKVDTVLSDMMCNISGIRDRDVAGSLELCESALTFAQGCLKVARLRSEVDERDIAAGEISEAQIRNHDALRGVVNGQDGRSRQGPEKKGRLNDGMVGGGWLVLKHFQHPDLTAFQKEKLNPIFRNVKVEKPKASRSESSEAFFVCTGYKGMP